MANPAPPPPRLRVTIWREDGQWRWLVSGTRCEAGPWVRIESAVASLEEVLGVETEWVKFKRGPRRLVVTGRPVDVEIRR